MHARTDRGFPFPTGWLGIDATQQAVARRYAPLSKTAPHLFYRRSAGAPILLYQAWREVLGKDPDYPPQEIGDCVGVAHGHANDLLQCVEIGLGEPSDYRESDTEFIYAVSREVAGLLGQADGSYGAAAVHAMSTLGLISREMLGDQGVYSGKRSAAWGRTGAPAAVKAAALPFKLGAAALVSNWDELVAALSHGYPVTICTEQGFTLDRDAQGFCAAAGVWGHCMFIAAVRFDRPGACVIQSWGPNMPIGPKALDQPSFSFWADRAVVERILAEGDSWAVARAPEFVSRALPSSWSYHQAA